jgi:hypothetical protein
MPTVLHFVEVKKQQQQQQKQQNNNILSINCLLNLASPFISPDIEC